MKLRIITLLLSAAVLLPAGCAPNSNAETAFPPVGFSAIASGDHALNGLPVNRKLEVFSDQTSFDASLNLFILPIVPHIVDFTARRVVFLSLGGRSSGGNSISVERIEDHGNFLKASIVIRNPGNNCIVTQAITSPFQFVEVESVKALIFEERVEVFNCP